jgi:Ca2+-transporting ATPase
MDDDLSTVVAAVEEGRRILSNIRAFLVYALSGGLAEVGVMLLGPAVGLVLPLLPAQILWINLVTHGMTGVAFGSEPASPDAMRRAPTSPDAPIFLPSGRMLLVLATLSLTAVTLTVAALTEGSDAERRTAAFLVLGLGQLGVALALRARLAHRALRERGLDLAVALSAGMLALGCVVPVLRDLLGTVALDVPLVFVLLVVAAVPGLLVRAVLVASR